MGVLRWLKGGARLVGGKAGVSKVLESQIHLLGLREVNAEEKPEVPLSPPPPHKDRGINGTPASPRVSKVGF